MPIGIDELIKRAMREQAIEYARFEIWQHDHRVNNKVRSPLARYNLSTPNKMHMSSLMLLAWEKGEWVTASQAAEKLHISRQAAQSILRECHEAGWVDSNGSGYRYTEKCAQHYIRSVDEMLVSASTNFTGNMRKLADLREILSSHLSLTSDDRSSDTDVREVKHG